MKTTFAIGLTLSLVILANRVSQAADAKDYLTADGELTAALEISDLQGGFAGFTGHFWKVSANGDWTSGTVGPRNQQKVESQGKLTKDGLKALAGEFAKYDLAKLSSVASPVGANPHNISLTFGKLTCNLTLKPGAPLPDPKDGPNATSPERVAGIKAAITKALAAKTDDPPKK